MAGTLTPLTDPAIKERAKGLVDECLILVAEAGTDWVKANRDRGFNDAELKQIIGVALLKNALVAMARGTLRTITPEQVEAFSADVAYLITTLKKEDDGGF